MKAPPKAYVSLSVASAECKNCLGI